MFASGFTIFFQEGRALSVEPDDVPADYLLHNGEPSRTFPIHVIYGEVGARPQAWKNVIPCPQR